RYVDGKREIFSSLFSVDVSRGQHPGPTLIWFDFPKAEFVFESLLSVIESIKKALMGRPDFVRTRPNFAGTGTHDRGFCGEAGKDPVQVVVGKGRIVCIEQSADWIQLGILVCGVLCLCDDWCSDCCGYAGYSPDDYISSIHS